MAPEARTARIPVIGIVGGVGSGKSTATEAFVDLGCQAIIGDRLGHEVLDLPETKQAIRRRWGGRFFSADGKVDRRALGQAVFSDLEQMQQLNAITEPKIRQRIAEEVDRIRNEGFARAIALDAAILFEAGWDSMCDYTVFVDAPEPLRAERVQTHRGWDLDELRRREKSQLKLDSKKSRCYAILDNSSDVSCLRDQVRHLMDRIDHTPDR